MIRELMAGRLTGLSSLVVCPEELRSILPNPARPRPIKGLRLIGLNFEDAKAGFKKPLKCLPSTRCRSSRIFLALRYLQGLLHQLEVQPGYSGNRYLLFKR